MESFWNGRLESPNPLGRENIPFKKKQEIAFSEIKEAKVVLKF